MSPEDALEALEPLGDEPPTSDLRFTYSLVVRHPKEGSKWLKWHNEIPHWLSQDQGRALALTLRDALRAEGFDVYVLQATVVRDVIE